MNEKELRAMDRAIKQAVANYKKDYYKRTGKAYGESSAKTSAASKQSAASKAGAKNKMKAQGAKSMGSPTSGYGKSTKPKGK